ncbi:MAG: HEAT repeat domain-containing protein [Clostridiales bacterium]|nr:HEAT repeat domain-containing protein [Clostridiales bacterium]
MQNNPYFIDFDKLFENYADKYYGEHEDEYDSPDDFARDLDRIYQEWATSPQQVIGGISPSEFFNKIPTSDLMDILKGSCVGENNPNSLLFDRIAAEPELKDDLIQLALASSDEKLLLVTLSLINEMGGAESEFYIDMVERDIDACVKEECIEKLCERADEVKEILLQRAQNSDDIAKIEMYVEPLTFCAAGDDRILALLRMLLSSDPNVAYVAALMGRYGDERACADLYKLLDDCDYAEFIEIRNAIETLGGTVDAHYRDFSADPLYKAIKGIK